MVAVVVSFRVRVEIVVGDEIGVGDEIVVSFQGRSAGRVAVWT